MKNIIGIVVALGALACLGIAKLVASKMEPSSLKWALVAGSVTAAIAQVVRLSMIVYGFNINSTIFSIVTAAFSLSMIVIFLYLVGFVEK